MHTREALEVRKRILEEDIATLERVLAYKREQLATVVTNLSDPELRPAAQG